MRRVLPTRRSGKWPVKRNSARLRLYAADVAPRMPFYYNYIRSDSLSHNHKAVERFSKAQFLCPQSWELLVLSKLKWDVAGVTAHDFLPLLLSRLPLRGLVDTDMVQRHSQTFIALAARGESNNVTLHSRAALYRSRSTSL